MSPTPQRNTKTTNTTSKRTTAASKISETTSMTTSIRMKRNSPSTTITLSGSRSCTTRLNLRRRKRSPAVPPKRTTLIWAVSPTWYRKCSIKTRHSPSSLGRSTRASGASIRNSRSSRCRRICSCWLMRRWSSWISRLRNIRLRMRTLPRKKKNTKP